MTTEILNCAICMEVISWLPAVGTHGESARTYHWKDGKRIHAWCDAQVWERVLNAREDHKGIQGRDKKL